MRVQCVQSIFKSISNLDRNLAEPRAGEEDEARVKKTTYKGDGALNSNEAQLKHHSSHITSGHGDIGSSEDQMSRENSCNSSQGSNFFLEELSRSEETTDNHDELKTLAATASLVDNERLLRCFYDALAGGNTVLLQSHLLAEDLDLWFHGPRCHQHMSKVLTGLTSFRSVTLNPSSILATRNNIVIAEGECICPWVHIWTVKEGKLIQLREYWNTALLLSGRTNSDCGTLLESPSIIWQSKLWQAMDKSKPGLILTI